MSCEQCGTAIDTDKEDYYHLDDLNVCEVCYEDAVECDVEGGKDGSSNK